MEKSFRSILGEFLEEKVTEPTPSRRLPPPSFETTFFWQGPRPATFTPRPTYPRPQPKPESCIALADLSPALRFHADMLIALGADELLGGLNLRRLKAAHRRLAKRFHPDLGGDPARFQSLREAYERLTKALA